MTVIGFPRPSSGISDAIEILEFALLNLGAAKERRKLERIIEKLIEIENVWQTT